MIKRYGGKDGGREKVREGGREGRGKERERKIEGIIVFFLALPEAEVGSGKACTIKSNLN